MKTTIAILTSTIVGLHAQNQSVTLAWNSGATGEVYRIYEVVGTNRVLLATTTNLFTTLTNVTPASYTWGATASNIWGESAMSVPLVVPGPPTPPTNLKPVSTTLAVPLPGIIESTTDLAGWRTRYRLGASGDGVALTQFISPTEPLEFMRAKVFTLQMPPYPR